MKRFGKIYPYYAKAGKGLKDIIDEKAKINEIGKIYYLK